MIPKSSPGPAAAAARASKLGSHVRRHVVGYIALFVAVGGVGYASIPDTKGVVHGCYDTTDQTNGASPLYVIDPSSTSSCPQGRAAPMTALDWNGSAPNGPQGPQTDVATVSADGKVTSGSPGASASFDPQDGYTVTFPGGKFKAGYCAATATLLANLTRVVGQPTKIKVVRQPPLTVSAGALHDQAYVRISYTYVKHKGAYYDWFGQHHAATDKVVTVNVKRGFSVVVNCAASP